MDDVQSGGDHSDQLIKFKEEVTKIVEEGGFHLHKWQSNLSELEECQKTEDNTVSSQASMPPRSQGSLLPALRSKRERETLENAGHVSPRICSITNKRFGEGAGKCEICL